MIYFAVRFSKKSGKIDTVLNHKIGHAMLDMWALTNTTAKSKDTIVFGEDGIIKGYYEGTGDFPKIDKTPDHIDKYCPGLLEALLADVDRVEE